MKNEELRMKNFSLHIAFAALLSLLSLASCSRNDEVMATDVGEGKVQVTFTLKLDDEGSASRGMSRAAGDTWGNEYDSDLGNEYDSRIDPSTVQVIIYEGNTYKCKVENLSFYKAKDNVYNFIGDIEVPSTVLTAGNNYKIMVFANCPDISADTNLSTLSFSYNGTENIPMWGVKTVALSLKPGERQDLADIWLLRAIAKVEVSMDAEGYEITSVSIDKSNTQGYCLPKDYVSVANTTDLDREEGTNITTFNPYLNSETKTNPAFINENGKYYIYLPEYDNSTDAAKIQVTVNDETYDLEFKDYVNGVPTGTSYDIVRNHIYHYTITGVNDGKLTVKYLALPWDLVTSEIGYAPQPASTTVNPFEEDNDYAEFMENGYILLPVDEFKNNDISDKIPDEYNDRTTVRKLFRFLYDYPADFGDDDARYCILTKPTYDLNDGSHATLKTGTAGARYFFMLTGLKGATWEAKLLNEDGTESDDFTFSYTPEDDFLGSEYADEGSVNKVSHGIARQKPYIIQVNCVEEWTNGTSFTDKTNWGAQNEKDQRIVQTRLYITVTLADGVTYNLDINPSYENSKLEFLYEYEGKNRRYAGKDDYVWIRQVPAQEKWPYDQLANNDGDYYWNVNPYWK